MNRQILLEVVDNPDPKFIAIVESLPEPKPEHIDKIRLALPQMYDFFLRKQSAYRKRDSHEFERILEQEVEFVRSLDELAFNY